MKTKLFPCLGALCLLAGAGPAFGQDAGAQQERRATAVRPAKSQLPMPHDAKLVVDARLEREAITLPPNVPPASIARLEDARVLSFHLEGRQPVPTVLGFFTAEKLLEPGQSPRGVFTSSVAASGTTGLTGQVEAGVYAVERGMLVISVAAEGPTGPTRVRVVEMRGQVQPVVAFTVALPLVEALEARAEAEQRLPSPAGAELQRGHRVNRLQLGQVQEELRRTPGVAPELRSLAIRLVGQATAVQISQYSLPRETTPRQALEHYRAQANRRRWEVLREDAVQPQRASALYRLPDRGGVLMLLVEAPLGDDADPPVVRRPPPNLTLLHLEGEIRID